MKWLNYIISFFTKHDLEYYPKYIQAINENGRLFHLIDEKDEQIKDLRKEIENFELQKHYYEHEIFQIRSKRIKSLVNKEETILNLERQIENLKKVTLKSESKVQDKPQKKINGGKKLFIRNYKQTA